MIHQSVSEIWVFRMGSTILEHPVFLYLLDTAALFEDNFISEYWNNVETHHSTDIIIPHNYNTKELHFFAVCLELWKSDLLGFTKRDRKHCVEIVRHSLLSLTNHGIGLLPGWTTKAFFYFAKKLEKIFKATAINAKIFA